MKLQNQWLSALIAALAAKQDHKAALAALVKHHGGKRTVGLMEDLLAGLQALHPKTPSSAGTDAEITCYMGQPNIKFTKNLGRDTWRTYILPHLPKIKAATHKGSSKSVDHVAKLAQRIMRDLTAAQRRRLVALVG